MIKADQLGCVFLGHGCNLMERHSGLVIDLTSCVCTRTFTNRFEARSFEADLLLSIMLPSI